MGKLATPDWIKEGYDSKEEYEKKKGIKGKKKEGKIFIEDAIEADKVFSMLMGDDVPARKAFIQDNAQEANLDI